MTDPTPEESDIAAWFRVIKNAKHKHIPEPEPEGDYWCSIEDAVDEITKLRAKLDAAAALVTEWRAYADTPCDTIHQVALRGAAQTCAVQLAEVLDLPEYEGGEDV